MLHVIQIVTLLLVSLAMATAVAHALELPGKRRLPKETYLAVQPIYFPGFTIVGGFGEILGILATAGLLFITPPETVAFRLSIAALLLMVAMHVVFWLVTQPVNKVWMSGERLGSTSAKFFGTGRGRTHGTGADWTLLRKRWEYSHVMRAVLSFSALALLAVAISAT